MTRQRTLSHVAWLIVLGAGVLVLPGCKSDGEDAAAVNPATPPDFAVEVFFDGDSDQSEPGVQRMKAVLQADRWLHVGRGAGLRRNTYPLAMSRLTLPQVEQLVGHVRRFHLLAEPTSPVADRTELYHEGPRPVYHVNIRAWARSHRYATTSQESPPTADLLQMLLEMGQIAPLSSPDGKTTLEAPPGAGAGMETPAAAEPAPTDVNSADWVQPMSEISR